MTGLFLVLLIVSVLSWAYHSERISRVYFAPMQEKELEEKRRRHEAGNR
jgi:hypothetical protein